MRRREVVADAIRRSIVPQFVLNSSGVFSARKQPTDDARTKLNDGRGDREFKSCFLQQRVSCELGPGSSVISLDGSRRITKRPRFFLTAESWASAWTAREQEASIQQPIVVRSRPVCG